MQSEVPQVIQQIVAPAVMVPACGLLLLSTSARMNTVLARIRAFHRERLEVWQLDPDPGTPQGEVRELRLEGLEFQTHRLLVRAALLRRTMLLLLCAVGCNLLTVIGLAVDYWLGDESTLPVYSVSITVFLFAILLMLGAMVTSVLEVRRIVETVGYEHERVERLCRSGVLRDGLSTPHTGEENQELGS